MAYDYSELELSLRAECERGFKIGPRSFVAINPTGEAFTELTNPDRKAASNEREAYHLALATFHKHVGAKTGTLYWRVYPEVSQWSEGWKFYMRVLVSDKVGTPA